MHRAHARFRRPERHRRAACAVCLRVGDQHDLHVEEQCDGGADDEPYDESSVARLDRREWRGGARRQRHEARDAALVVGVLRILARGEHLGDVERGVGQHEEEREEKGAEDGPI